MAAIAKGADDFDRGRDARFGNTQGPAGSYMHSMRSKGQSAIAATQARDRFVSGMLNQAKTALAAGDREGALRDLGVAIYPLMDATSPYHSGANGPIEWSGGFLETIGHVVRESSTNPSAAQYRQSAAMIRSAYLYVFGPGKQ